MRALGCGTKVCRIKSVVRNSKCVNTVVNYVVYYITYAVTDVELMGSLSKANSCLFESKNCGVTSLICLSA